MGALETSNPFRYLAEIATIALVSEPGNSDVKIAGGPPGRTDKRLTGSFNHDNLDSLDGCEILLNHCRGAIKGVFRKRDYEVVPPFYCVDLVLPDRQGDAWIVFNPGEVRSITFNSYGISIWLKHCGHAVETNRLPIWKGVVAVARRIFNLDLG